MRRARIVALVALPVLLVGAGCRDTGGDGSGGSGGPGGSGDSVEHQFDDIESTLDSIESELNE